MVCPHCLSLAGHYSEAQAKSHKSHKSLESLKSHTLPFFPAMISIDGPSPNRSPGLFFPIDRRASFLSQDRWTGGDATFVQVGDILDQLTPN